jgi:hypothetical protein
MQALPSLKLLNKIGLSEPLYAESVDYPVTKLSQADLEQVGVVYESIRELYGIKG